MAAKDNFNYSKPFFYRSAFFFCLIITLILPACSDTKTPVYKKVKAEEKSNRQLSLLIGLIPERNIFEQMDRYKPIANYISEKTGLTIKLKVLTRYGNIVDNFISLGLDGAFFGSFTYTLAHAKLGVEPLVRPENLDGSSTYYGLIFVRKDSGINGAADMKGKTFAFVDEATTAGYLAPLAYFRRNGIKDYMTYFKETYFTGTHEDAIYDVLNGKADIGAAKNTMFYRLSESDTRVSGELFILYKSLTVPENCLAVKEDLPEPLKKKLKNALLNMSNDPDGIRILKNFGVKRFIETTDSEYEEVYKYLRVVDLGLATYDYIND